MNAIKLLVASISIFVAAVASNADQAPTSKIYLSTPDNNGSRYVMKLVFVSTKKISMPSDSREYKLEKDGVFRSRVNEKNGLLEELRLSADQSSATATTVWTDGNGSSSRAYSEIFEGTQPCVNIASKQFCKGSQFTTPATTGLIPNLWKVNQFYFDRSGQLIGSELSGIFHSADIFEKGTLIDLNNQPFKCTRDNAVCIGDSRPVKNFETFVFGTLPEQDIVGYSKDGIITSKAYGSNVVYEVNQIAKLTIQSKRFAKVVASSCYDLSANQLNKYFLDAAREAVQRCEQQPGADYCEAHRLHNDWGSPYEHEEGADHKSCTFVGWTDSWAKSPIADY